MCLWEMKAVKSNLMVIYALKGGGLLKVIFFYNVSINKFLSFSMNNYIVLLS